MQIRPPAYLKGPNGAIAYRRRSGSGPGVVWLGGYRSDMLGTKAHFLDDWAHQRGRAFLRFDYTGHGESEGDFEQGTISAWAADAIAAFDALTQGPQILVGSSMGAWTATLLARERPTRIVGAVFIAPAPDFTERLMRPSFTDEQRETLQTTGRLEEPSDYDDEPTIVTLKLLDDARNCLVMNGPILLNAPVRILQGMADESVPWRHALDFAERIESDDVEVLLTKAGDHRLSTPADLSRLSAVLDLLS